MNEQSTAMSRAAYALRDFCDELAARGAMHAALFVAEVTKLRTDGDADNGHVLLDLYGPHLGRLVFASDFPPVPASSTPESEQAMADLWVFVAGVSLSLAEDLADATALGRLGPRRFASAMARMQVPRVPVAVVQGLRALSSTAYHTEGDVLQGARRGGENVAGHDCEHALLRLRRYGWAECVQPGEGAKLRWRVAPALRRPLQEK